MRVIELIINKPEGTYYMVHRNEDGEQMCDSVQREICYNVTDFISDCMEFGFNSPFSPDSADVITLYRFIGLPLSLQKQAI